MKTAAEVKKNEKLFIETYNNVNLTNEDVAKKLQTSWSVITDLLRSKTRKDQVTVERTGGMLGSHRPIKGVKAKPVEEVKAKAKPVKETVKEAKAKPAKETKAKPVKEAVKEVKAKVKPVKENNGDFSITVQFGAEEEKETITEKTQFLALKKLVEKIQILGFADPRVSLRKENSLNLKVLSDLYDIENGDEVLVTKTISAG